MGEGGVGAGGGIDRRERWMPSRSERRANRSRSRSRRRRRRSRSRSLTPRSSRYTRFRSLSPSPSDRQTRRRSSRSRHLRSRSASRSRSADRRRAMASNEERARDEEIRGGGGGGGGGGSPDGQVVWSGPPPPTWTGHARPQWTRPPAPTWAGSPPPWAGHPPPAPWVGSPFPPPWLGPRPPPWVGPPPPPPDWAGPPPPPDWSGPPPPPPDRAGAERGRSKGRSRGRRGAKGPKISIPENWADVPAMGGVVGDSRFVAIRVPLDAKYAHLLTGPEAREPPWSPRRFVEEQAARDLDVRLVVDLTNTGKYYDGEAEFRDTGIEYAKLRVEGFRAPPQARDVARFTEIVDEFVAREPAGRVAVHCTHGLNRTGYLVVDYMVQRLGCSVTEALAAFSAARPPGLIKHMYVEDLYRRLGRDGEEVQLPVLPDWAASKYAAREQRR